MLAQVLGAPHAPGSQQLVTAHPTPSSQRLNLTNNTSPQDSAHSHSIPTPPNDTVDYLYCSPTSPMVSSPESEYLSWHGGHGHTLDHASQSRVPSVPGRGPLLPSTTLNEDDCTPASPATPPSSIASSSPHSSRGSVLRRDESEGTLAFTRGSSIWSLKKEEVAPGPAPNR